MSLDRPPTFAVRAAVVARAVLPISTFVAGIATALLALYVALSTAPGVIMADDMVDALAVVANSWLSQFPKGSVVYVKSSGGPMLLERLHATYPSLRLLSFSERPADESCTASGDSTHTAHCERNDFLKLEVLSAPTRGTMLVAVGTSNAFGQILLLRFFGRWRVLVTRSYAV
jgi:hypothetical protein